jgi:hypothetical protein
MNALRYSPKLPTMTDSFIEVSNWAGKALQREKKPFSQLLVLFGAQE